MYNYRVIFRVSLSHDDSARVANKIKAILKPVGILPKKGTTGTFEKEGVPAKDLAKLCDVLMTLASPEEHVTNAPPNVYVNHLWLYID